MSIQSATRLAAIVLPPDDEYVSRAIQRTIRYADFFDQAVSAEEILRYLDVPASRLAVRLSLQRHAGARWRTRDGLYCLPGREALFMQTRRKRARSARQWRRARFWARVIAHLPFVRMLAVTGSLAVNNLERDGDIDYFVVCEHRRVWTTRLFIIGVVRLAHLLGDVLCPNYLVSSASLLIRDQNLFTARELAQMVPLFGADFYARMMALNTWALAYLPAAGGTPPLTSVSVGGFARCLKGAFERLLRTPAGGRLEAWEMRRKIERLRRISGAGAPDVILDSDQCKGHFRSVRRSALRVLRS